MSSTHAYKNLHRTRRKRAPTSVHWPTFTHSQLNSMKKYQFILSLLSLIVLASCGSSTLEDKIVSFEKGKADQSEFDIEVVRLKEIGNVTGADSLNLVYTKNLTDTGLPIEAMKNWTADSMIAHYTKMLTYYKTTISAFTYTASVSTNAEKTTQDENFVTTYKAALLDDSTRLGKLTFFNAHKDSVLAIKYECQLKLSNPNQKNSPPQELIKIVAVSKDKSVVIGSVPKGN